MSTTYTDDYTKLTFVNDSAPALNATNMNHMESGIKTLYGRVANMSREVDGIDDSVGMLGNAIGMRGWNQLIPESAKNITITSGSTNPTLICTFNITAGHIYFISIDLSRAQATASDTDFQFYITGVAAVYELSSTLKHRERLWAPSVSGQVGCYVLHYSGFVSNVTMNYFNVIDLTSLFGAGNEPSTVEEFRSMFPADYYPYCPILNANALLENLLPTEYSTSTTYPSGAITLKDNAIWQNTSGSTVSGNWNASYWTQVRLGNVATLGYTEVATW